MKGAVVFILALIPGMSFTANQLPYSGEELRSIKSLSAEEIESLKSGGGMGFAKLAELNHFPGPKHVLQVADDLDLTPSQLAATETLYEEMRLNAIALGEKLIGAEMGLDRSFALGVINSESLESALFEIGKIRAQLRYVHLEAHLRQKSLLTEEQISRYDEVRGYRGDVHDYDEHPNLQD
jgi:hypothetical protein